PSCSSTPASSTTDIVEQAKQSESDDLQIALRTKDVDALETYLQKYPETTKRAQILNTVDVLKRSEFTEWTLFELGDLKYPQYIKLSSIQRSGNRVTALIKWMPNPSLRQSAPLKDYPDTAYS